MRGERVLETVSNAQKIIALSSDMQFKFTGNHGGGKET